MDETGKAKQTPATWLASKMTPNRISRIEADGDLDFRQLRARTIVTAQGKQVSFDVLADLNKCSHTYIIAWYIFLKSIRPRDGVGA